MKLGGNLNCLLTGLFCCTLSVVQAAEPAEPKVNISATQATLQAVLAQFKQQGVELKLETTDQDERLAKEKFPSTLYLKQVPLSQALEAWLAPHRLAVSQRFDQWAIVDLEAENDSPTTIKIYPIRDLLHTLKPKAEDITAQDYEVLIEVITSCVHGESWDAVGGQGTAKGVDGALVVQQSEVVHGKISRLLEDLKAGAACKPGTIRLPSEEQLHKQLDQPIKPDADVLTLVDLPEWLHQTCGLNVVLNGAALKNEGISLTQLLKPPAGKPTLRSVLSTYCSQHNLCWYFDRGVLWFTAREGNNQTVPLVYPVRDLLVSPGDDPMDKDLYDYDSLVDLLINIVSQDSWDEVGGFGSVGIWEGCLVVSQTFDQHQEIDQLLAALRSQRLAAPAANNLQQRLDARVSVNYQATPLKDVWADLQKQHKLTLTVDETALAENGVEEERITLEMKDVRLRSVLNWLVDKLRLVWVADGDGVKISNDYYIRTVLQIYEVSDLFPADLNGKLPALALTPDRLMELLEATVEPDSWDAVGGQGTCRMWRRVLLVSKMPGVQEKVYQFLSLLRASQAAQQKPAVAE